MKLVAIDNYCQDDVADILIADNVPCKYAGVLADYWNELYSGDNADRFCVVKDDEYRLHRGMEDLI
ncbi:hypothetical protein NVP1063O_219 [Vibrio phage 1.063.O._10N.261.45.C7]|nr:hypothetical protein NVP1063O_219 [Vibrio phage 1.063.O._10N.261.45.C7]